MTPSEQFVYDLCQNTFLSLWSFPNPIGKKGKELCDILIICDPDIIIISVKEISVKGKDYQVDAERWERNAINESIDQIYGAERFIKQNDAIYLKDRITKIDLPKKEYRNIYRIAVAFGRGEVFSLKFGDFGKGFVHVFDELSVRIILQEVDTITDFLNFLKTKETFIKKGIPHLCFSEEDYLAMYFLNGFRVTDDYSLMTIDGHLWEDFSVSKEYQNYKEKNKISYIWDGLIETLCKEFASNNLLNEISRSDLELAIRVMNKESRLGRRNMSTILMEVLGNGTGKPAVKARIIASELSSTTLYVIMNRPFSDREYGMKELYLRCLVARSLFENKTKVIGLATEPYLKGNGYSLDIYYLDCSEWDTEQQFVAESIKNDLGYFKTPQNSIFKSS